VGLQGTWGRDKNGASLGRGAAQTLKRLRVGPLVGGYHQKSIGLQREINEGKVSPERSVGQSARKENLVG
jgi:hypothetical protein